MYPLSYCSNYFKKTSNNHFGTVKYWKDLELLFEKQNGRCAYSGMEITLGQNSTLDHIIPKHRGGKTELGNLQWTKSRFNRFKGCLLETEFFELIKAIYEYRLL